MAGPKDFDELIRTLDKTPDTMLTRDVVKAFVELAHTYGRGEGLQQGKEIIEDVTARLEGHIDGAAALREAEARRRLELMKPASEKPQ